MKTKRCGHCKKTYEAEDLSQHFSRQRTRPDGLYWCCKLCKKGLDAGQEAIRKRKGRDRRRYEKLKHQTLARSKASYHYAGQTYKCSVIPCQAESEDLHHVNYDSPLDVVPLCKRHHKENHDLVKFVPWDG